MSETTIPERRAPAKPSANRALLITMAYLGPLALLALLVEDEDPEVRWHAARGFTLLSLWLIVSTLALTFVWAGGYRFAFLFLVIGLTATVVHGACIVRALRGGRLRLPLVDRISAGTERPG